MTTERAARPVLEMRVAVTTNDFARLVKFYCDGLGLEPAQFWNNGQGQALIIEMGNGTLELFNEAQAQTIDKLEAGRRLSGQVRLALQMPGLHAALERLPAHVGPVRLIGQGQVRAMMMTPCNLHEPSRH